MRKSKISCSFFLYLNLFFWHSASLQSSFITLQGPKLMTIFKTAQNKELKQTANNKQQTTNNKQQKKQKAKVKISRDLRITCSSIVFVYPCVLLDELVTHKFILHWYCLFPQLVCKDKIEQYKTKTRQYKNKL